MPIPGALGIDFGTSHTVAVVQRAGGGAEPLLFDGSPLLPSAVFAEAEGTTRVGRDAVHAARMDPARLEPSPKRRVDDETVLLGQREVPVIELIAAVLRRVREECERVLGGPPESVTLTHPAAWGPSRRLVLADAAEQAGLATVELRSEPVAAADYFVSVLNREVPDGSAVVVYDFGGGTFDASVVSRTDDGFTVLAVDGKDDLGGLDVDEALVRWLRTRLPNPEGWTRLLESSDAAELRHRRALYDDVRTAKESLSRHASADIAVPVLDRDVHLTRAELETVAAPLLHRAVRVTQAVIRSAYLPPERIAGVFLVGGASRMPLVATTLHRELDSAPVVIDQPELVVAHGAVLGGPRSSPPSGGGATPTTPAPVSAVPSAPDSPTARVPGSGATPPPDSLITPVPESGATPVPDSPVTPASGFAVTPPPDAVSPPIPAAGLMMPQPIPAGKPRRTATVLLAAAAAFALLLLAITGIGSAVAESTGSPASGTDRVDPKLLSDSRHAVEALFSYDYRSMDDSIDNASEFTTGKFREKHRKTMEGVRESAENEKATVEADTLDIGVVETSDDSVEILAFINQTVRNKNIEGSRVDESRVALTMVQVDSQWKVADSKSL
ncbi:MAG: Hsp70 family protein [Stackebrandtia sp.]